MTESELVSCIPKLTERSETAEARVEELEREREQRRITVNRVTGNTIHGQPELWYWQDDGHDHPESIACPVIVRPEILRRWVAAEAALEAAQRETAKRCAEICTSPAIYTGEVSTTRAKAWQECRRAIIAEFLESAISAAAGSKGT